MIIGSGLRDTNDNMTHPLDGCWAKVERGKEHAETLEHYISQTFAVESNRPNVGIKLDPNTGEYILYVSGLPDLSEGFIRIGVLLGDIVHNFRSALDHLVFQLAMWNTKGHIVNPKNIGFPTANKSADFLSAKGKELAEVDPAHQAIIERFQPYNRIAEGLTISVGGMGGYFHSFALLDHLWDMDKHRLLTPVMILPTGLGTTLAGEAGLVFLVSAMQKAYYTTVKSGPIELGTEVARAKLPDGMSVPEMKMAGYVHPVISLPEGWPIHHVVRRIATLTVRILSEFQPLL